MEDKSNDNINNTKILENKKIKEEKDLSFIEFFLNDIDIIFYLKESISNQKKFISFIIDHLKKLKDKYQKKEEIQFKGIISKKIFLCLISNAEVLGIPFFTLLINEQEFSRDIIFGFFYENLFKNEIIELLHKIIDIFNFEYEEKDLKFPIENYYKDLIDYGIIEPKDLTKFAKRESPTEEELIFARIEFILFGLKRLREIGNNLENDASEFFNSLIVSSENDLSLLKLNNEISNASFEFYQEKIEEVKNFKNKKPKIFENLNFENKNNLDNKNENDILKNKNDNNEIKNINEEEEEEENEMNNREFIEKDIKELRRKPLKDRIYFYKNEQIIDDEDLLTEFKNYYFPLRKFQIEELSRQFCSFLNSDGGRLYLGIDDDKTVKGVVIYGNIINYEEKLIDLVKKFSPKINEKEYFKFYAIPVKNNQTGEPIDNLFVFKIRIKKGNPAILYSISNEGLKSAIRLQGQCANLTAEEIHKEIIERNKYKNNLNHKIIEEDKEMDDPLPIITQKIFDNVKTKKPKKGNKNNNDNKNKDINDNDIKNININIKEENNNNFIQNMNNNENKNNEIEKNFIKEKNEENNNEKNEENINLNKKNKKKNKKKHKNKNELYRVEISNIDKNVDENALKELFGGFQCEKIQIFRNQNISNGTIDFSKEEDADNFIEVCNNMTIGNKQIHLKKVTFNI